MLELWLLIALIILIAVIYKPLSRTIFGALDGHAAKVRAELEEAKRLREEAQSLLAEPSAPAGERRGPGERDRRACAVRGRAPGRAPPGRARGEPRPPHRARLGADRAGRGARAAGGAELRRDARGRAPPSACCATRSTASRRRPCSTTRSRRSAASSPEAVAASAVIKLYQFPPVFGRNVSPFTLKLETWLKLAGLPYQVVAMRNPGQGPKGKLPFIEDDDGSFIADSSLIIEHLSRSRGIDLDAALGPVERAQALALQRLFEDHLYFVLVWSRWLDPEGWRSFGPALFHGIPPPLRQIDLGLRPPPAARRPARPGARPPQPGRDLRHGPGRSRGDRDPARRAPVLLRRRSRPRSTPSPTASSPTSLLVPIETELERIARGLPALVAWTETMERRLS